MKAPEIRVARNCYIIGDTVELHKLGLPEIFILINGDKHYSFVHCLLLYLT